MIIDAHQHYWDRANPFTNWPPDGLSPIDRNFLPDDLKPDLLAAGIGGSVLVQAAPDEAETHWLLSLATEEPSVLGVVGWVDLASPDAIGCLQRLAKHPLFKGVRPMLQDITEPEWILGEAVQPALSAMAALGLRFDALVRHGQMGEILQLAQRNPGLRIVLDHGGKPDIAGGLRSEWLRSIEALAVCPNVWCKLSGLWTEAGDDLSDDAIAPFVSDIVTSFGAQRTIWGSDWPVLNLAGDYQAWLAQCHRLLGALDDAARARIFGLNAMEFYGLGPR